MKNNDGKFEKNLYHTIPETKNISLPINENHIMLGIKKVNEKGIEYPVETPFFVCPKEIRDVFGDEPTELTVFFPSNIREEVFPQAYEKYGKNNAMLCQGDGDVSKTAQRLNLENGRWEKRECPCEHYKKWDPKTKTGGCSKVGHLRFMIPSVSIGTFYQCSPHGTVSIQELNSAFELADKTTGGHWAMIPFRMKRVAKKLKIPGTAKMKTHWVVTLEVAASTEEIRRVIAGEILYLGQLKDGVYKLEAPELPKANDAYVAEETDEEEKAREAETAKKEEEAAKEINESRNREAELKKKRDAGETGIRTPSEAKKIAEEKEAKIAEIEKVARAYKVNEWPEIIEIGERYNILPEGLSASQAKTFICDHPEKYAALWEAIKGNQETTNEELPEKEKIDKIFETLKEAGFPGWKEIAGFACMADLIEPGTAIEDVQKLLLDNPEAVEKIIERAKIRKEQEIADEDIPD